MAVVKPELLGQALVGQWVVEKSESKKLPTPGQAKILVWAYILISFVYERRVGSVSCLAASIFARRLAGLEESAVLLILGLLPCRPFRTL